MSAKPAKATIKSIKAELDAVKAEQIRQNVLLIGLAAGIRSDAAGTAANTGWWAALAVLTKRVTDVEVANRALGGDAPASLSRAGSDLTAESDLESDHSNEMLTGGDEPDRAPESAVRQSNRRKREPEKLKGFEVTASPAKRQRTKTPQTPRTPRTPRYSYPDTDEPDEKKSVGTDGEYR